MPWLPAGVRARVVPRRDPTGLRRVHSGAEAFAAAHPDPRHGPRAGVQDAGRRRRPRADVLTGRPHAGHQCRRRLRRHDGPEQGNVLVDSLDPQLPPGAGAVVERGRADDLLHRHDPRRQHQRPVRQHRPLRRQRGRHPPAADHPRWPGGALLRGVGGRRPVPDQPSRRQRSVAGRLAERRRHDLHPDPRPGRSTDPGQRRHRHAGTTQPARRPTPGGVPAPRDPPSTRRTTRPGHMAHGVRPVQSLG